MTWLDLGTIRNVILVTFLTNAINVDILIIISVLKSSPRTGKRPATGPDRNRFGPDYGCSPGGFSIGLVAVAEG